MLKLPKYISCYCATWQSGDLAWYNVSTTIQTSDTVSGVKDARWRDKVEHLQDATNPYSRVIFPGKKLSIGTADWTWLRTDTAGRVYTAKCVGAIGAFVPLQTLRGYSPTASPDLLRAKSDAKLAFLSKIRENLTTFQSLPFLGELKETIGMIQHPLRGILKHTNRYANKASRLQRLLRSKPNRLQESLEKAYLQWTYGVSPLINDVKGMVEGIRKLYEDPGVVRLSVSIPVGTVLGPKAAWIQNEESGAIRWVEAYAVSTSAKVRIRGAMKTELVGPSVEKVRQLSGANLRDFIPAAWELLPWSFVVDYFTSVGDVVNGAFTDTSSLVYAVESTKTVSEVDWFVVPINGEYRPLARPVGVVSGHAERVSFNRSKADLHVGISDFHWVDPTAGQWFNTAVLGLQQVRKRLDRVEKKTPRPTLQLS